MLSGLQCVYLCASLCACVHTSVSERERERDAAMNADQLWALVMSHTVMSHKGEDRPRGEAGRSARQRNYSSSPLMLPQLHAWPGTIPHIKVKGILKYLFTHVLSHAEHWPLFTSTAICGCYGNSHRPNQPHSSNTQSHLHITGNTVTPSPTHCYYLSVSCNLPALNMSMYSSMKGTEKNETVFMWIQSQQTTPPVIWR